MTFREVLAALWRRKLIIVAVVVLAVLAAGVYAARAKPNYESTTTLRISPTMSQAISSGALVGLPADVDPSIVASDDVLGPAAQLLGVPKASLMGTSSAALVPPSTPNALTVSVTVTSSAPTAGQAQERAKAVATAYAQYLDGVSASTTKTLEQRKSQVEAQANTYSAQIQANPNNRVAQANLADAVTTLNTVTTSLSTLALAGPSATVTTAAAPGTSTNPSRLIVGGLALVCGLLAGMGIALVRDRFDERLRGADEIGDLTDAPVLGELANDRKVARNKVRLTAIEAGRTALSEGIRSLRTSVQVLLTDGRGAVAITSVEPGDGKTFLSANLALSWARAGRRVILVGGDLRRPEVHAYFPDADDGPGLGGLLVDAAEGRGAISADAVEAALCSTPYRGLRILPPGHDIDDPADLLAGYGLSRIIRHLTRMADIVVVDTPPALVLADASVLGAHTDGVILLTTANRTRRGLISEAADGLRANDATLLGVVVNRVSRRLPHSYGSYYGHDAHRTQAGRGAERTGAATRAAAGADGSHGDDRGRLRADDARAENGRTDDARTDDTSVEDVHEDGVRADGVREDGVREGAANRAGQAALEEGVPADRQRRRGARRARRAAGAAVDVAPDGTEVTDATTDGAAEPAETSSTNESDRAASPTTPHVGSSS